MKLTQNLFAIAVGIGAASLIACGGSEKPAPKTAAAPQPESIAPIPAPKPTPATEESKGAVVIDSDILKICGIADDEAYFPFDSSNFVQSSIKPLNDVAKCFTSGPLSGKSMQLVGHADPRGDNDYNFALAQRRADAVGQYLVAEGLGPSQETTTSRGAMDATGSDENTWSKDRRVDVLLVH